MAIVFSHSMVAKIRADITDYQAKLRTAWRDSEDFFRKTEGHGKSTQKRVQDTWAAAMGLRTAMVGIAGTAVVAGFTLLGDQAKVLENQMRGIGVATEEAQAKLYRLAMETRTPIQGTVALVRSLSKSLRDQPLDQTLRQVATLNRMLTVGGLDTGQRSSVVLQLGQALQSGVLQGDELRALRESAPFELMQAIAKEAGGTVASLRDLGTQGKLTTEVVVRALNNLEQESKDRFGNFKVTLQEAADVTKTAMISVAGRMDEGLGATDMLAQAQVGLAEILMNGGDAAEALGESLRMVAEFALLAAGVRGVGALGSVLMSLNASALTLTGTMAVLRGALGGVITLLGGPVSAAVFAVGAALLVASKQTKSFSESLDDAKDSMSAAKDAASGMVSAREALRADQAALEEAEKRIAEAIRDQATAAEDTARREAIAIQARINENSRLLEAKQLLSQQEFLDSENSLREARATLAGRARSNIIGRESSVAAMGGTPTRQFTDISDDAAIQEQMRFLQSRVIAGEQLTEREEEWLRRFTQLDAAEKELARTRQETMEALFFGPSQKELEAAQDKVSQTLNELLGDVEKRSKRLKDLADAQDELDRQIAEGVVDPARILAQREEIERQVVALTNAGDRLEDVGEKFAEVKRELAVLPADEAKPLIGVLETLEQEMRDIIEAGGDVDNIKLTSLEDALRAVAALADSTAERFKALADIKFAPDPRLFGQVPGDLSSMASVAIDPSAQIAKYTLERSQGRSGATEELVREVSRAAAQLGVDAKDLLTLILFESGGSPSVRGGDRGRHIGLIQFGPEEQQAYGAHQDQTVTEQMVAVVRYLLDRGTRPGDDLTRLYATVLGGNRNAINASDIASGGVVRNVAEATRGQQFAPYRARAEGMLAAHGFISEEELERYREAKSEEEQRAEARKSWLANLDDSIERSRIEAEIANLTATEQQRILFIEQQKAEARQRGIDLSAEDLRKIEAAADAEIEALRTKSAIEKQREEENLRFEERRAQAVEIQNERLSYTARMQQEIRDRSIDIVMNARSWSDVLEGAGDLLKNVLAMYAEALLQSAMFGQGPLSQNTSGSGGLFGGLLNLATGLLGGIGGGGGFGAPMVAGGDALSGALRDSFSTAAMVPSVASFASPVSPFGRQAVDVNVSLNSPMLEMTIDQRAGAVVEKAAPVIQVNAQRSMIKRMQSTKKGWAD